MKKFNLLLILFIVFLFIISCGDDFLNLAPKSDVNEIDFYNSQEDIELAVNAAYASLQNGGSYGHRLVTIPEMRSDNTTLSWMEGDFETSSIVEFGMTTSNERIATIWDSAYRSILMCNIVLDRVNNIDLNEDLKNQYIREVKFLRALQHFNLVRLFGDVPLIVDVIQSPEESYEIGRTSVDEVYNQIVEDLIEAAQLPLVYSNERDIGRVTGGAAKALLGKVYLTHHNFNEAAEVLKEVIDSGVYNLMPDYADLWDPRNGNNMESIFEVQFKKGGTGTGSIYANQFAPRFSAPYTVSVGSAGGQNSPTQDLIDAYEENDLRKYASMSDGFIDGDGEFVAEYWVVKFFDEPFQPNDSDNNWPVLRYADVLLMYAEALNEISFVPNGEAFDKLNLIRDRAGLAAKTSDNTNPDFQVGDQEAFRVAIEQERRVELAFENHRYFDLIRTGRFVEVMNQFYNVHEHHTLFPIPQGQIDINPSMISQNPGY
ncbi:MAG: RagB/SusD family nutrient uptake outer membrane protein [Balneolaceae bacterium]|nr:RagB/SusD family nutrient uptake outer membrane protein [Balneolaceae bacterium]